MSFNRERLDLTYVGPYVGDIENCEVVRYGVNMAYRAGIDLSQYNYFIVLRNADFDIYECSDYGAGDYFSAGSYYPYEGGALSEVGVSTIVYPFPFSSPIGSGQSSARTVHEFLHGYGRGTAHSIELICFSDPGNPDTTRVPYHYVGDESVLTSPYCRRGKSSWIDVMGGGGADYLEVNSILKQQYRWITPGQSATVNGSALSAGQTITLKPIETPAAPKETQSVVIPIPGTTKAYVLELRGGPVYSGVGVYVYLTPGWYNFKPEPYQEQYLLHIGDDYLYDQGPPYPQVPLPAPLKLGQTIIDPKMKLAVTIISASSTGAVLRVFTAP